MSGSVSISQVAWGSERDVQTAESARPLQLREPVLTQNFKSLFCFCTSPTLAAFIITGLRRPPLSWNPADPPLVGWLPSCSNGRCARSVVAVVLCQQSGEFCCVQCKPGLGLGPGHCACFACSLPVSFQGKYVCGFLGCLISSVLLTNVDR